MSKRKIAAFAAAALMACGMGFSGTPAALSPFSNTAIEASAYSKNTEGFVKRMYKIVLGREADSAGLKNWTSQLNSGKKTAADLINGFFFSDEYKKKQRSSEAMVTDCYKAMLDRAPDSAGMTNWKKRIDIGMSIQAVCKGFVGSSEFRSLCSSYGIKPGNITLMYTRDENYERTYFVYRLYKNCLGRTPDISGLESWCQKLKKGTTGSQIAYGFVFCKEYMDSLNAKTGEPFLNNYVRILYNAFLGRNPDTVGKEKWKNKLREPNSLQFVFNGLLMSSEFREQCDKAGIKVGQKIADPFDFDINAIAKETLEQINKKRAEKGVAPLKVSNAAVKAAEIYIKNKLDGCKEEYDKDKLKADCGLGKDAVCAEWVVFTADKRFDPDKEGEKFSYSTTQGVIDDLWGWSTSRNMCLSSRYKYIGIYPSRMTSNVDGSKSVRYTMIFVG